MSEKTNIEWTDSTASPWTGCTEASPGCANCYAKAQAKRYGWLRGWGKGKPRLRFEGFHENVLWMHRKPWVCESCGVAYSHPQQHKCPSVSKVLALPDETNWRRRRIFPSACDWLDAEVPIEWLANAIQTMHQADELDKLLLTKRPENWRCLMERASKCPMRESTYQWLQLWILGQAPERFWIGTSVEDQERADERIPRLLQIPARVRFLSCEPLLGPITIRSLRKLVNRSTDWVIVGGESGPKARPCNVEWIRSIVRQCRAAGVPCFVKQLGSNCYDRSAACELVRMKYKHPKGGDMDEWPEDLRVQQFPVQ
jgi:protein gp37